MTMFNMCSVCRKTYMTIHNFLIWQLYFHICSIADFLFTFSHSGYKCIELKLWNCHQHLLVTLKSSIKQNNMGEPVNFPMFYFCTPWNHLKTREFF